MDVQELLHRYAGNVHHFSFTNYSIEEIIELKPIAVIYFTYLLFVSQTPKQQC